MRKKLLAILGSPHRNGATGTMLDYAVKIAEKKGWQIDFVYLYEKKIAWCSGCRACQAGVPTFPLRWECVSGAVLKGENSLEGAAYNENNGKRAFH